MRVVLQEGREGEGGMTRAYSLLCCVPATIVTVGRETTQAYLPLCRRGEFLQVSLTWPYRYLCVCHVSTQLIFPSCNRLVGEILVRESLFRTSSRRTVRFAGEKYVYDKFVQDILVYSGKCCIRYNGIGHFSYRI